MIEKTLNRLVSVAPMMDYTDRHERYFLRLISQHLLLYTEMVTTQAILNGNLERLLGYNVKERPLALQVGGSNPKDLAECAKIGQDLGYNEVNLNLGCPSPRVQLGRFGACLMAEPDLVAHCIETMRLAVQVPVTIKTRIGIDDRNSQVDLWKLVQSIADVGCETVIIHARKAWLKGLSPKQNREVPPLHYDLVYQLKRDFPLLEIVINGGIASLNVAKRHLDFVDGVMIGREAYKNPYFLAEVDKIFYGDSKPPKTRAEVLNSYFPYVEEQLSRGVKLHQMTRHIMGLFNSLSGAKSWRRYLSEKAHVPGTGADMIRQALQNVSLNV